MKLIKQVCLFYMKKEDVVFTSVFEMYFGEVLIVNIVNAKSATISEVV